MAKVKRQGKYGHGDDYYKKVIEDAGLVFVSTWSDDKYRRHVKFICKCGESDERFWRNVHETMLCSTCARKKGQEELEDKRKNGEVPRIISSKRITVEEAIVAAEAQGCVFVSLLWIDNENQITYICECSKDDPNAKHHKTTYYYMKNGKKCMDCASERAQATIKWRREQGILAPIDQSNHRLDEGFVEEFVESFDCVYIDSYFVGDKHKRIIKIFCSCSGNMPDRPVAHIYWDNFRIGARCVDCVLVRKEATCMERFGVKNPMQCKEIMDKVAATMVLRYGARHLMHIPYWRGKIQRMMSKREVLTLDGRDYVCQGYEHHALMLLYREGYDMVDVWGEDSYDCPEVPQFKYRCREKDHVYYPDIYIKSERRFIEVKSEGTLNIDTERVYAKIYAVQSYGFHIDLWIIGRNGSMIREERFPAK